MLTANERGIREINNTKIYHTIRLFLKRIDYVFHDLNLFSWFI